MNELLKKTRRAAAWFYMLNKRLFRRWSFLIILALAPVMVWVMSILAYEDKGVINITVYSRDSLSSVSEIIQSDSVINIETSPTEEDAVEKVRRGECDGAWIFDSEYYDIIDASVKRYMVKPVVKAVMREDTLALKMAREKLYSAIYKDYNYDVYKQFVKQELNISDEAQIEEVYKDKIVPDKLFKMVYLSGEEVGDNDNYLLSPVRGLLAAWLVLFGLVSGMYYMQDKRNGLFDRMGNGNEWLREAGYHLVILIDAAIIMGITMCISGLSTSFFNELKCMLVFVLMVMAFCCIIRKVCIIPQVIGMLIPLFTVIMLGLGPVFITLKEFVVFKYINPTYLYLMSIHSSVTFYELCVYCFFMNVICYLLYKLRSNTKI